MKKEKKIHLLSDDELIKQIIKTNNTYLFAELYDRYSGFVYNKCLSFASCNEEAQDLTHDIFIKLFVKLRTFKGEAKFSTWLYSFTFNFCVNYITRDQDKKNRKVELQDKYNFESSEERLFELKTEKLKRALSKIDPKYKMVLILKYQEGLSVRELADLLNLSESAIKMRMKRARKQVIIAYQRL